MKKNENKERRNSKKVLMVAGLALLLGLVGYTGGQTYAKYITQQNMESQSATVAKWGYTLSVQNTNLFGEAYGDVVTDETVSVNNASGSVIVSSELDDDAVLKNVVAPGAKGQFTFSVNGQAEVLSKLTVELTSTNAIQLKKIGTETVDMNGAEDGTIPYEPIKWSVTGDNPTIGGTPIDITTWTDLSLSELETKLSLLNQASIAANTEVDINLTVSWVWPFEKSGTITVGTNEYTYDELDTLLGVEIADGTPDANIASTTMDIALALTVEQIQA